MSSWQKILCLLLLSFISTGFLMPAPDQTHVYIIETHKALTAEEGARLKSELKASTLDRMTPYRSSYFERIYRIESTRDLKEGPSAHPLIKKIERPASVESLSYNDSEPDPFLAYQWAINNTGQAVEYDIDDITIGTRVGVKGMDIDLPTFELKVPR